MHEHLERVITTAKLARIDLCEGQTPEESQKTLDRFAAQFKDIVGLMDTLAEVDTEGVEPLYWPLSAPVAPPREDVALKTCTREDILGNAPDQDGRFFIVPKIV